MRVIADATPCAAAASAKRRAPETSTGNRFALEQHPAQHVLGRAIALFGSRAVQRGGAQLIRLDAFALEVERGEIALRHRVAATGRGCQPFDRKDQVPRDSQTFGEAGANVVLRPGVSCPGQGFPECECQLVIPCLGGGERGGHFNARRAVSRFV